METIPLVTRIHYNRGAADRWHVQANSNSGTITKACRNCTLESMETEIAERMKIRLDTKNSVKMLASARREVRNKKKVRFQRGNYSLLVEQNVSMQLANSASIAEIKLLTSA